MHTYIYLYSSKKLNCVQSRSDSDEKLHDKLVLSRHLVGCNDDILGLSFLSHTNLLLFFWNFFLLFTCEFFFRYGNFRYKKTNLFLFSKYLNYFDLFLMNRIPIKAKHENRCSHKFISSPYHGRKFCMRVFEWSYRYCSRYRCESWWVLFFNSLCVYFCVFCVTNYLLEFKWIVFLSAWSCKIRSQCLFTLKRISDQNLLL